MQTVSLPRSQGVVRLIRGRSVYSRAPWGSLGSSSLAAFTRARPACRWIYLESLGSLAPHTGVCRVHPGSFGLLARALCVAGLISGFEFTRARPWGRCIHVGLLGSLARALGVDWFIGGRWVR